MIEQQSLWIAVNSDVDANLLNRAAGGDEQAFHELYQRHSGPVYNYILRLVQEPSEAEDLLQEAFVAVWKGAWRYRGQASVKTWMYRIAHNQAVSWLRRNRPTETLLDVCENRTAYIPEAAADEHWNSRQVLQALNLLSPKHRAVLELAFVQELPYAEIAQIVACPIGTVKSRISYAIRALGAKLNHDETNIPSNQT